MKSSLHFYLKILLLTIACLKSELHAYESCLDLQQSFSLLEEIAFENKMNQHDKFSQLKSDIKTMSRDIKDRLDSINELEEAKQQGEGLDNLRLMQIITYMKAQFTTIDPELIQKQINIKKERLAELILQLVKVEEQLRVNPALLDQEETEIVDPITLDDITNLGDKKIKINRIWYSKNSVIQYLLSQIIKIYKNWNSYKDGEIYNNSKILEEFKDIYRNTIDSNVVKKLFADYKIGLAEITNFGPQSQYELSKFNRMTPTLASLMREEVIENHPDRKAALRNRIENAYRHYNIEL